MESRILTAVIINIYDNDDTLSSFHFNINLRPFILWYVKLMELLDKHNESNKNISVEIDELNEK